MTKNVGLIPTQTTILRFQESEYDAWSTKMRILLISQDFWEFVDKGYEEKEIFV